MVRDQTQNPGRKEHGHVAQIGDVNLVLVARKYARDDQVVGTGNQGEEPHARGV
jgi:hypothetical protein